MKALRTFLLALVVIGAIALFTQKSWVPKLADQIISAGGEPVQKEPETIIFPTGGEDLRAGQTYTLRWSGGSDPIQIFLVDTSLKSEGASVSISDRLYGVPNTGLYEYTIPTSTKEGIYELQIGNQTSNPFHVSESTSVISFDSAEYTCTGGKSFKAEFSFQGARVFLSDKREFLLLKILEDDESGIKFTNVEESVSLWVKDDSAFIEENGETTYESCRITKANF